MSAQDWVIRATTGPEYWSNAGGWVSRADADVFTAQDVETLRLPLGGAWERADAGPKARLSYRVWVEVEIYDLTNSVSKGKSGMACAAEVESEAEAMLLAKQLHAIGESLAVIATEEREHDEQVRAESREHGGICLNPHCRTVFCPGCTDGPEQDEAADRAKERDSERDVCGLPIDAEIPGRCEKAPGHWGPCRAFSLERELVQTPGEYLIEVAQRSKEQCVDCGTTVAMTEDWTLVGCELCEDKGKARELRCTRCFEAHWQASHPDD